MNLYKFIEPKTGKTETVTAKSMAEAESLLVYLHGSYVELFSITKIYA